MSPAVATASEARYLNYPSAARYAGMSEQTLRRLVAARRLKVYRPTGARLTVFDRAELDDYIHGAKSCPQ
jgi:excisionase family DNA binding protein